MKSDKKLKNLIENSADELRKSNKAFYDRMSAVYDAMPKAEKKKKSFWLSPVFVSSLSACLVFALVLTILLTNFIPNSDSGKHSLENNSTSGEVSLDPSDEELTDTSVDVVFNIENENLAKTSSKGICTFGEHTLFFDNYSLLDNFILKNGSDNEVGSIISGVGKGSRFQIVIVKSDSAESKLTSESKPIRLDNSNLEFKYDYVGEKAGMSYFYAEAESGDNRLVVDFMTTLSGQDAFAKFLNDVVR